MAPLSSAAVSMRTHVPEPIKRVARRARREVRARRAAPELSVVVPSYNVESYLAQCLDSLIAQTFGNLEIIVVDDGSTDGSWAIARDFAKRDHRIRAFRQENSGQGIARNRGVDEARGEFLTFIDADDTVPPRAFDYMIRTLRKTGSDFCVGSARRFSNQRFIATAWAKTVHLRDLHRTTLEEFPLAMQDIIACNRVFRTDFWRTKVGGFRGHIAYEDHVPMLTAYVRAQGFDILSGVTYNWRIREDQTSTSQQKANIENLLDRIAVKEEAHNLLLDEGSQRVYDTWVARALEVDFPPFVTHALAGNDMYRAVLTAAYRTLLSRATPAAMAEVRFIQKARAWLVAHDRWDDLETGEDYFREVRNLPTTRVEEGRIVADPQEFLSGAPDEIRALSPVETRFDGALIRTLWRADSRLEVEGFALIRALDMPEPDLTEAWLEQVQSGDRAEVEVKPVNNPEATIWARDNHARYDGGGFVVLIDPASLDDGVWQLHIRIHQGGVSRESSLHRYVSGGSALSPTARTLRADGADGSGRTLRVAAPHHSREHGFVVELSSPPVALVGGELSAHRANGTLSLADGTTVRRLFVRGGQESTDAALSPPQGSSQSFALDLPTSDGSVHLRADVGLDKPVSVAYGLPEDPAVSDSRIWQRTPSGGAAIDLTPPDGLVHSAHLSGDSLVLDVWLATRAEAADLRMRNNRLELTPDSIEVESPHRFRVSFPLVVSVLGGPALPIPTGVMRLHLGDGPSHRILGAADPLASEATVTLQDGRLRVVIGAPPDAGVTFAFGPPLNADELSLAGQRSLQLSYQANEAPLADSVLFQCYRGESATDSQRALDEALRMARPDLTRYWGVSDYSVAIPDGSVPLLFGSKDWYDAIATSRYLCNNIDFDGWFRKRPGQQYLQTFHGYPFKSMGRSFWSGKGFSEERISRELDRRNAEYDAILVPSERAAGFYRDEYDYTGRVLVTGYPRSDFPVIADRAAVRDVVLRRLGVDPGQKVILYAPTYRDNLTTRTYAARRFDELDLDGLTQRLGSSYTLLLRGHNNNQRETDRVNDMAEVVDVTDYPEINDLTVAADAAILDYSSLRFDWALTGKPMVFFVPDLETYFGQRPPLFAFEESSPGPLLTTTAEVAEALGDLDALLSGQREEIARFNQSFNRMHDGHATERVVEEFFRD